VVSDYLAEELAEGRIVKVGTPQQATELGTHCSPFGVIPKKHKPGKWRLIVSAPEGSSVNDGTDKDLASLSYVSVDDVAAAVLKLGQGAVMAKMDIKTSLSEHPSAPRHLLGVQ
jgi:hypothetical protein